MNIATRTAVTVVVLFVCGLFPLAYFSTAFLESGVTETLLNQQASIVRNVAHGLEQRIELRIGALQDVAAVLPVERIGDRAAIGGYISQRTTIRRLFPGGILVIDREGAGVADFPVVPDRATGNFREMEYFEEAFAMGRPAIGKPRISPFSHQPEVAIAVPVKNGRGEVAGVLVGFLGLADNIIFDREFARLGKTGEFILVSRTYRTVIVDSHDEHTLKPLDEVAHASVAVSAMDGENLSRFVKNQHGADVLVSDEHILSGRWVVVGLLPAEEALAPVRSLKLLVYGVSALILGLIGSLTWWIMHVQLGVVGRTTQSLRRMAFGEEPLHELPVERQDEIGEMLEAFNRLQQQIGRLTRFYAALSQCNEAIVRSHSEEELFPVVCRIAVECGGMKMAWVGMVEQGSRRVVPVASYGDGVAYLEGIYVSVDPADPHGHGPTGISIRENRPFWCQDYLNDAATALWRERGARCGWRASASIPLLRAGAPVGALMLYADTVNAFDEQARRLLGEMAVDIGFALDNFAHESARKKSEERLRESEASLKEAQLIAGLGSYVMDIRAGSWESSEVLDHLLGIDGAYERSIAGWINLVHPADRRMVNDYLNNEVLGQGRMFDMECRIIRQNDQAERWVLGLGRLEFDAQGRPRKMRGTLQDITVRKQSEAVLLKLSLAVEQNPNSIIIADLDCRIEYTNAAFTRSSGYSLEDVLGKTPRILQSGKTPRSTYDDMWAHLRRGEVWRGELINRHKDGHEFIEFALISPVRQADGRITNYLAIKEDITEKKKAAERMDRLVHFDQLTGLPNRSLLADRFRYALSLAERNGLPLTVMFLDIDHFKRINDTLGHTVGDQLLMEAARRLKEALRDEDTVSRHGGDEFIMLLPDTDADGAAQVASKLIEAISKPLVIEQHELMVTPSIGVAVYPLDGENFETLLKSADTAMYRAKSGGRNNFCFFRPEMQAYTLRTLQLANALRYALERDQLCLYYQPQVSILDGHVIGAEALLRWQHPELGMVSPAEFIPVAEDSGQIIQIGEWVLRTAVNQLKAWMDRGMPPMTMAVNLSAVQFRQPNIGELVTRILDEAGVPHEYLELELTEAVAMDDPQAAVAVMDRLHGYGIQMAIDDFGTGYSSLSYLKKFKVQKLKIDQSFVRDITDDPEDKAIVGAIINLATCLDIRTIAEGVETAGQLAFLRLQGCGEAQGYYFSKPLPAQQFEKFMKDAAKNDIA